MQLIPAGYGNIHNKQNRIKTQVSIKTELSHTETKSQQDEYFNQDGRKKSYQDPTQDQSKWWGRNPTVVHGCFTNNARAVSIP